MPVRATVEPLASPGHATLRVSELGAAPDGLTLSIQRQQGPDTHLGEDGWRRTEAWLAPERVRRVRDTLEFDLGPEICDRLAGIATVRLRVKEPDIGVVGTTVLAWPSMLTSGAAQATGAPIEESVRPRPAPEAPEPAPVLPPPFKPAPKLDAAPDLRAAREPAQPAPGMRPLPWMIAVLVMIVAAAGGYWAYTKYFQPAAEIIAAAPPTPAPPAVESKAPPPAPAPAEPPKKSIRNTVGEFLATRPTPEAMAAKAREYAAGGEQAGAFLIWRSAAEAGNPQAQLEVASFYDPLSPQPKTGFSPDAQRAADWYERAALAGLPEAQRRYGLLLAKGGPGLPADPAKARTWLQQAAAQNDADARKALESLPR
jgi:Sel1 repeat